MCKSMMESKLSGKITEDQMIDMNYQVNVEKKKPTEVARIFLKNEGLVKEAVTKLIEFKHVQKV